MYWLSTCRRGSGWRCRSLGGWALPTDLLPRPVGGGGSEPLQGSSCCLWWPRFPPGEDCRGPCIAHRDPVPPHPHQRSEPAEPRMGALCLPELPAGPRRGSVPSCHRGSHSCRHLSHDQSPSFLLRVPWTLSLCGWLALPQGTGPGVVSFCCRVPDRSPLGPLPATLP